MRATSGNFEAGRPCVEVSDLLDVGHPCFDPLQRHLLLPLLALDRHQVVRVGGGDLSLGHRANGLFFQGLPTIHQSSGEFRA